MEDLRAEKITYSVEDYKEAEELFNKFVGGFYINDVTDEDSIMKIDNYKSLTA